MHNRAISMHSND